MKSIHPQGDHRHRRRAAMAQQTSTTRPRRKRTSETDASARTVAGNDMVLAKQTVGGKKPIRRPSTRRPAKAKAPTVPAVVAPAKKNTLTEWLSPKNIQQSISSVNNLRGVVKNCLNYLQQADQMLETFYVTSNSLKETGVLDKLVKNKGKNLTTEDFTGLLAALMSSPLGGQMFKAMAGGDKGSDATPTPAETPAE